jgi:hypothetical protein
MINNNPASLYQMLPNTSVTNADYLFWHPYWVLIRDCLMGEIMVKRRGTMYLPRMESQTDDEYTAYLMGAVFYNATKRTVDGLVGSVHFRPALIDDLPENFETDSVTKDGQSFETFLKRVTREVVSVGRFGILGDAPQDGGEAYLTGYDAEDIVDWTMRAEGSRMVLEYVLLREVIRVRNANGTGSEAKDTFRMLYLDEGGIYRQRYYPDGNVENGVYEEYTPLRKGTPMQEIPFIFVNPYDFGAEVEKPPILDIALLNLSHYRSYAQLEAGRFYTATPIWTVMLQGGADDQAEFTLGPNTVWQLGMNDKAEIIEFSGAGLKFLESALSTKEQQISALGGRLSGVARGTAAESAESVIARERGEASFLQSIISTMGEAGGRMLNLLAYLNGGEADIKVRLSSEAVEMYLDARQIRAIESLYKTGLLPIEVIYAVFRDAAILPADMGLTFNDASDRKQDCRVRSKGEDRRKVQSSCASSAGKYPTKHGTYAKIQARQGTQSGLKLCKFPTRL